MALREELKQQGDYLFKHRSFLPLILIVIGIWVQIYQAKFVGEANQGMTADILKTSAIYIGLLGLLVRIFTVGYTPKNTSGRNTSGGQLADELNTTGIYSMIRNPLYLGNYLMWVAIALLTGSLWFVLLFSLGFWIYYERIIFAEEAFLRNKFGETYLKWTEKTPPFLPTHLRYVKPSYSFSWKKVLKKEKNGLFALFLLFFVFETIGQYAADGTYIIEEQWMLHGTIITGILYFILKIIKKYTKLLHEEGR